MTRLAERFAVSACAFFLGFTIAILSPSVGWACLAEYRSPDWLVGHSPLAIIGTVEKVEDGLVKPDKKRRRGDNDDSGSDDDHHGKPTIATVRITRILKGEYSESHVRVGGGPCQSCGGDWFYSFRVGDQHIFILPKYPQNGKVAMKWGRSLCPLSDTNMIESQIARLAAYRAEYLAEVQKERPKIYAAGVQLAERMRKEKAKWPTPPEGDDVKAWEKHHAANESASEALAKMLADVPVEAIRVAQAVNWFSEKTAPWWEQFVWNVGMDKLVESRHAEVTALNQAWVRGVLRQVNVEKKHIDEYLNAAKRNRSLNALAFPPDPPGVDVYSGEERNKAEQALFNSTLTTDFILRCHSHYRGMMLPAYAGTFSAAVLANLDPKRVKPEIDLLYQSDDERLRWLAHQAIGYMPGADFVDLPLEDMMENGKPWAWRVLDHYKQPKETAGRLTAMIDLASKCYTDWGKASFWACLREGKCFHPACIEKAIAALEQLEKPAPKNKNAKNDVASDAEHNALAAALREYLAEAKKYREPPAPSKTTASEFRQWFKDHPEKKENPDGA